MWRRLLMNIEILSQYVGAVVGAITIVSGIVGLTLYVAKIQFSIKEQKLESELNLLRQKQESVETILAHARRVGYEALIVKTEIDELLSQSKQLLRVEAASVLVPYPSPDPNGKKDLVFLSIDSPNAGTLRRTRIPADKGIAGWVLHNGRKYMSPSVQNDPHFFNKVDQRSRFVTRNILCLPIYQMGKIIGVIQFLNKKDGEFTEGSVEIISSLLNELFQKVGIFVSHPEFFGILGLSDPPLEKQGTILTVDISNSTSLLEILPNAETIDILNEYLENVSEIGLSRGATIDKFLGDGLIMRFNVPKPINNYAIVAFETALEIHRAFERLKENWLKYGLPVGGIYNRIGMGTGTLYEVFLGPPQYRQNTVMGVPMIVSSYLCERSSRDRNVLYIDDVTYNLIEPGTQKRKVSFKPLWMKDFPKIQGLIQHVYDVILD
ncbi:MAG: GAF domain-containing protein [Methanobacteriota archaeon]|nr:MAG: GAF domain-containing protein [Euryarchaeota archaeon]